MAVRRILTRILCCGAITLGAATPVRASPFGDPTAGRAVFTGATAPSASSITLDPAALGLGTADEIYVATTSVLEQVGIGREHLDLGTGGLTNGARIDDTQLGPGGVVAFLWHPSNRLTLGVEARLPPPELFPKNHDELRYHTLGAGQRDYAATVGVSLRVTSSFYFGVSLTHQNTSLRLRYARDTALEAGNGLGGIDSDCGGGVPCGVENPAATELYDVEVSTPAFATQNLKVTLGAVVQLAPDVWLGVGYHTPPGFDIQTALTGTMNVTRAPRDGGDLVRGGSTVYVSFPASIDAELRARLPRQLDLHVGGRWKDLSRMQAYDVRGYGSTFRNAGIPEWTLRARGLHDSFALWAGLEQNDTGETFRFGARLGIETSSLSDERTSPLTIAPTSYTFDIGAQARVARGSSWLFQLSYGLQLFPTVSVESSAYDPRQRLDCVDSGFDYATPGCAATRNGYAIPTADGEYSKIEHAVRAGFRYVFP